MATANAISVSAGRMRKICVETHSPNLTFDIISIIQIVLIFEIVLSDMVTKVNTGKFHWKLYKSSNTAERLKNF